MLRLVLGVAKREMIRNQYIRETIKLELSEDKMDLTRAGKGYWTKSVEYGAAMQTEKRKTTEESWVQ